MQLVSFGLADATVPSNVKNAANYYVHDAIASWTKKHIKVKDPAATHFCGNIPVTGFDHVSITRAPQIADLVVSTVHSLLAASATPAVSPRESRSALIFAGLPEPERFALALLYARGFHRLFYAPAKVCRRTNCPAPGRPTNLPPSTITRPRESTVLGTPLMRMPSNIE